MFGVSPKPRYVIDYPVRVDPVYGCHLWTGRCDPRGYPIDSDGKWAHRTIWVAARAPLKSGEELDHVCRRRRCVRPEHLEKVTRRENVRRIAWRGRANRATCSAGHDLYRWGRRTPEGGIVCRQCCKELL
jgi:hypothetical protein